MNIPTISPVAKTMGTIGVLAGIFYGISKHYKFLPTAGVAIGIGVLGVLIGNAVSQQQIDLP